MTSMRKKLDPNIYLQPGYDAGKLTINELLSILGKHSIDTPNQKQSKAFYVDLFATKLAPLGPKILLDIENIKPSNKGIEMVKSKVASDKEKQALNFIENDQEEIVDRKRIALQDENTKRIKKDTVGTTPKQKVKIHIDQEVACPQQDRFFIFPELPGVRSHISASPNSKSVKQRALEYELERQRENERIEAERKLGAKNLETVVRNEEDESPAVQTESENETPMEMGNLILVLCLGAVLITFALLWQNEPVQEFFVTLVNDASVTLNKNPVFQQIKDQISKFFNILIRNVDALEKYFELGFQSAHQAFEIYRISLVKNAQILFGLLYLEITRIAVDLRAIYEYLFDEVEKMGLKNFIYMNYMNFAADASMYWDSVLDFWENSNIMDLFQSKLNILNQFWKDVVLFFGTLTSDIAWEIEKMMAKTTLQDALLEFRFEIAFLYLWAMGIAAVCFGTFYFQ